ncbi:hypothetical protein [Corynebacterium stationis]|uniref:hypothetical protein n=1 Tax=Corynebacterium stationis TaxID=1705 RepID=UPI0012EB9C89|nr:hypothetical protein [Corynebacterium stationis]
MSPRTRGPRFIPRRAKAVQFGVDHAMIGNRYPVAVGLVGDTGPFSRARLERLPKRAPSTWRSTVQKMVEQG